MLFLAGDLGPTASYTRREYAVLAGLDWGDGRQAVVVFNHFTAKSRVGRRSHVSRYAVSEVPEPGSGGRSIVWDKELGEDEHGDRPARKPPYTVRIDGHGQIRCQCQADACHAPTCRHADCTLLLLYAGVFDEVTAGA
jgi:hypothetical protein